MSMEGEWQVLSDNTEGDLPFTTFEWYKMWWQSFSEQNTMCLLVVHADGHAGRKLVAALPLLARESAREFSIWANTHSFRTGILCHREFGEALDVLASHLAAGSSWRELLVPYLPADYAVHRQFVSSLRNMGLRVISTPGMQSPWLKVEGEFQEQMKTISRSRRESLNRKRRKLLDKSDGRVEITVGRVADLEERLEQCWMISSKTWKYRAGSSIASDEHRIAFYNAIGCSSQDWLVLGMLYLDNNPIAFEYNLLYKGCVYNLKLGFDEEFSKISPGIVLRLSMLEWVFENDVERYDYMGNAADYKTMFSTGLTSHENLCIYNNSISGLAKYFTKGCVIPVIKDVLRPVKHAITGRLKK